MKLIVFFPLISYVLIILLQGVIFWSVIIKERIKKHRKSNWKVLAKYFAIALFFCILSLFPAIILIFLNIIQISQEIPLAVAFTLLVTGTLLLKYYSKHEDNDQNEKDTLEIYKNISIGLIISGVTIYAEVAIKILELLLSP